LSNDLSWEAHVNTICAKVAPRLYYLKQSRRAWLSSDNVSYLYLTVIRPVLEYGCAAWHHGLSVAQSEKLESLQKRALRIIHYIAYDMQYDSVCAYAALDSPFAGRYELGRRFFRTVTNSESCLQDLLPQQRDSYIISRLRRHTTYPIPWTRTNQYRYFVHFAPAKYQ